MLGKQRAPQLIRTPRPQHPKRHLGSHPPALLDVALRGSSAGDMPGQENQFCRVHQALRRESDSAEALLGILLRARQMSGTATSIEGMWVSAVVRETHTAPRFPSVSTIGSISGAVPACQRRSYLTSAHAGVSRLPALADLLDQLLHQP